MAAAAMDVDMGGSGESEGSGDALGGAAQPQKNSAESNEPGAAATSADAPEAAPASAGATAGGGLGAAEGGVVRGERG